MCLSSPTLSLTFVRCSGEKADRSKTAGIAEAQLYFAGPQGKDKMGMRIGRLIGGDDMQPPGHAKMHNPLRLLLR